MRRFLLLVLLGLPIASFPVLAQMAEDSTDFSGAIAASCSISDLADTISMNLQSQNWLSGFDYFNVTTNIPSIRVSVGDLSVEQEPSATGSAILRRIRLKQNQSGSYREVASGSSPTTEPLTVSTLEANGFGVDLAIYSASMVNNLYELPPGNYSYVLTISCLLP